MTILKERHPRIRLERLCQLFGITRQAYYQHFWRTESKTFEEELVVKEVLRIRQTHRRMGTRKLYELLEPFMLEHQIKMGRDTLFDVLARNNLLVKKRKRKVYTTNSHHWLRKYTNLTKGFIPSDPNELWVSDITYWKVDNQFLYISLITDAYSHKIVGYNVAETLETKHSIRALKMALLNFDGKKGCLGLVHHSDRGIQYCSGEYVALLLENNIKISMTESGDPLDNAIAERINGIIKNEYLMEYEINNLIEAKKLLKSVVEIYNTERPHASIGYLTPYQVHNLDAKGENLWKK